MVSQVCKGLSFCVHWPLTCQSWVGSLLGWEKAQIVLRKWTNNMWKQVCCQCWVVVIPKKLIWWKLTWNFHDIIKHQNCQILTDQIYELAFVWYVSCFKMVSKPIFLLYFLGMSQTNWDKMVVQKNRAFLFHLLVFDGQC